MPEVVVLVYIWLIPICRLDYVVQTVKTVMWCIGKSKIRISGRIGGWVNVVFYGVFSKSFIDFVHECCTIVSLFSIHGYSINFEKNQRHFLCY